MRDFFHSPTLLVTVDNGVQVGLGGDGMGGQKQPLDAIVCGAAVLANEHSVDAERSAVGGNQRHLFFGANLKVAPPRWPVNDPVDTLASHALALLDFASSGHVEAELSTNRCGFDFRP